MGDLILFIAKYILTLSTERYQTFANSLHKIMSVEIKFFYLKSKILMLLFLTCWPFLKRAFSTLYNSNR